MADNIIENIEDIDTTLNPVTKDDGLEMLGNVSDQPVVLKRFSRAIFKIGGLIKGLGDSKENKFNKNSAFNKNKSDAVNSNDSNTVATSKAVKTAYDRGSSGVTKADTAQNSANSAQTKANEAYTLASEKEPKFSKKSGFNLAITHVVNSTSKILVASALAVKTAYDKAIEAVGLTNTNKNAIQNNTEQIENLFDNQIVYSGSTADLSIHGKTIDDVFLAGCIGGNNNLTISGRLLRYFFDKGTTSRRMGFDNGSSADITATLYIDSLTQFRMYNPSRGDQNQSHVTSEIWVIFK